MPDDRCGDAAVGAGSHRQAREELWAAAITRYVVEVDFGPARAIVTVVGAQQLPAFVDLERLPRIKHRRRAEICRGGRVGGVGEVDDGDTNIRSIGRLERGAVVSASVTRPVLELGRLAVRTVAPALAHELQIAVEAVEGGCRQRRRYLPLKRDFRMIAGATYRSRHGELQCLVANARAAT